MRELSNTVRLGGRELEGIFVWVSPPPAPREASSSEGANNSYFCHLAFMALKISRSVGWFSMFMITNTSFSHSG